jgi:hypothetical protein
VSSQAQERAQQVAGRAHDQAHKAAGEAKNRLREQLDQRSSQAAETINQQASDFRAVGESLREQGKDGPAKAADKLAEYAEKVGGYLRDRDSDALFAEAEDYGRRQPWTVMAGGLALGFAASRFLKASSNRRYSERPSTQGSTSGQTPPAPRPGMSPIPAGTPYQPATPGTPYQPATPGTPHQPATAGAPHQPTSTGTPYRPTTTYSAATDPAPVTPPDGSERVPGPVGTPPATPGI